MVEYQHDNQVSSACIMNILSECHVIEKKSSEGRYVVTAWNKIVSGGHSDIYFGERNWVSIAKLVFQELRNLLLSLMMFEVYELLIVV